MRGAATMPLKRKKQRAAGNRIITVLREHEDVLKRHRVKRIGLFGSYAKGIQRRESDIDFLVEFEQPNFDDFMSLAAYLERLFGKKIDLLTPEGVKGIRVRGVAEKITRSLLYV
jgi:predicted nucleotidyltransferase